MRCLCGGTKEELEELKDIEEAAVDFINQRVTLSYNTPEAFSRAVEVIAGFEEVEIVDGNAPRKKESHVKEIVSIALSALFFVPGLFCISWAACPNGCRLRSFSLPLRRRGGKSFSPSVRILQSSSAPSA